LAVAGVIALFVAVALKLPSGTGAGSLAVRATVAFVVGGLLIALVRRMLGALGGAPPAPPPTVEAGAEHIVYECSVCGTRVRLEVAATGKAPKHCGEEMDVKLA